MNTHFSKLAVAIVGIGLGGLTLVSDVYGAGGSTTIKSIEFVDAKTNEKDDPTKVKLVFPTLHIKVGTAATGLKTSDFTVKSPDGYPLSDPPGPPPTGIVATKMEPFKDSDEELNLMILVQGTVRFMGDPNPEQQPGDTEAPAPIIGYYDQVKQAIDVIAKARPKHAKVGLYVYGERVFEKVPMGPPADGFGDLLGIQKDFSRISTKALRDGLLYANTTLSKMDGRRVLFVIGDGGDTADNVKLDDVIDQLDGSSIEVYIIGADPHTMDPRNIQHFTKLGKLGKFQQAQQAEQIPDLASSLANEINNVYTVDFPGEQTADGQRMPFDGQNHDVIVSVKAKDDSEAKTVQFKKIALPPPPKVVKASLLWLWILLGVVGLILIIVLLVVLLRKGGGDEEEEDAVAPPPIMAVAAPMPAAPAAPQKTMMFGLGGGEDSVPVVGWIIPTTGPAAFQTFKLVQGKTLIGTAPEAQVNVNDPYMSTKHAEIIMNPNGFTIVDSGSTNGILVNAKKVGQHELVDNDVFTCGKTDFKFKSIN